MPESSDCPATDHLRQPVGHTLTLEDSRDGSGTRLLPDEPPAPVPAVAASSLDSLKAGDRLDKYIILDVLGRGGMGIVFKAHDTLLERTVAIKVLGPLLAGSPVARKRFIREGQTAAAVKHEHIVTIFDVEGQETPYLVLEYVEGTSLEDLLLRSAPLPIDDVIRIGTQVAKGLAAAHRKGLVHRDIKPANILIEKNTGRVCITDFGLARAVDDMSLSRQGEVCGTPHYMAPEQVAGGAVDHRADLFSLGSVLYYMCTGELPFTANNSMAVLHRVLEETPRSVATCNRAVPAWLVQLIESLHAKDPERRIQSADKVAEVLAARGEAAPTQVVRGPVAAPAAGSQPSGGHSPALILVPAMVFLASLPAFYFLRPGDEGEQEREQPVTSVKQLPPTQQSPEATDKAPPKVEPERREVPVTPPEKKPDPPEPKKPAPPPKEQKGVVVVLINDPPSMSWFRDEGLTAREMSTSKLVSLVEGRNELPLGEFRLEQANAPARVTVTPRRFTVTGTATVLVNVTRKQDEIGPKPGDGLPPERPPFPPPGHPPPPPPRR